MTSTQRNDMPAKLTSEPPRRGPWNQHEDDQLIAAAKLCSVGKWVEISQMIGHRTPKQCRERWYQNLKPDLNHSPITQAEGLFIEKMVDAIGRKWAEIARMMENRSDNAVKNWWNGGVNRRKRGEEKAASSCRNNSNPLGPRTAGNKVQKKTAPRPHHHGHHSPPQASAHQPAHLGPNPHYSMNPTVGGPQLPPITVPHHSRHYEGNNPSPLSAAPSLISDHPSHYSPSPATSPAQYAGQYSHRSSIAYSRPSSSGYGADSTAAGLPSLSPIARPELHEQKLPPLVPGLSSQSVSPDTSLVLPPIRNQPFVQSPTAFSPVNGARSAAAPDMHMLNRPAPIVTSPGAEQFGRRLSAVSNTPTVASPRDSRMSVNNLMA